MIDWIEDWNQKMWNTTSKIIDKLTESLNIEKIPFLIFFNHPSFAQPLLLQPMAIAVHVTCQDDQSRFGEVVSSENQTCSQDNAKPDATVLSDFRRTCSEEAFFSISVFSGCFLQRVISQICSFSVCEP